MTEEQTPEPGPPSTPPEASEPTTPQPEPPTPAGAVSEPSAPQTADSEGAPVGPAVTAPAKPATSVKRRDWTKPTPGGYHWGTGRRKKAIARVRIRPGAGEFKVNKRDADVHFRREVDRQTIRAPLEAAEMLKKLDVFVNVSGGGTTGQAGAIMLGVARAIYHYDSQFEQALRNGGYLTRDSRQVERKKYGQRGARRRFQFSKR